MAGRTITNQFLEGSKPKALLAWGAIGAAIVVVTLGRLIAAHEDFREEALSDEVSVLLFIGVNLLAIGGLIAVLVKVLNPPNVLAYALIVILSFPAIIATPLAVSSITGTDVPGNPESVKLSDVYTPWEGWLKDRIEEPVIDARANEIKAMVDHYVPLGKAGKTQLIDRLDASLSAEGQSDEDIAKLKTSIQAILDVQATPYPQRLRQVARKLYAEGHRPVVQDLGAA